MAVVPLQITGLSLDTQTGTVTVRAQEFVVGDHPDPANFTPAVVVEFRLSAANVTYANVQGQAMTHTQAATVVEGQKTRPRPPAGSR